MEDKIYVPDLEIFYYDDYDNKHIAYIKHSDLNDMKERYTNLTVIKKFDIIDI